MTIPKDVPKTLSIDARTFKLRKRCVVKGIYFCDGSGADYTIDPPITLAKGCWLIEIVDGKPTFQPTDTAECHLE